MLIDILMNGVDDASINLGKELKKAGFEIRFVLQKHAYNQTTADKISSKSKISVISSATKNPKADFTIGSRYTLPLRSRADKGILWVRNTSDERINNAISFAKRNPNFLIAAINENIFDSLKKLILPEQLILLKPFSNRSNKAQRDVVSVLATYIEPQYSNALESEIEEVTEENTNVEDENVNLD